MRASRHVRATISEDGVVFMDVRAGLILSANRTGARVWQGLLAGDTPGSIADALSAAYDIEADAARADVDRFVRALLDRGILEPPAPHDETRGA